MRRWMRRSLFAAGLCVAVAGAAVAGAMFVRGQTTKALAQMQAIDPARGIDVTEVVEIGGIRQWISIRGRDRANPVLLFLHGGPGSSMANASWTFQPAWEDYFTVVQWDQRGAGRTALLNDGKSVGPTLGFDRMVTDAEEVTAYLRRRLGREKIFVVGHSWGTLLGLTLAHRRPEWLHAYVGMGQVVHMPSGEALNYAALVAEAERRGDVLAMQELKAIAPYPGEGVPSLKNIQIDRKWLARYGHVWGGQDGLSGYVIANFLAPNSKLTDAVAAAIASRASGEILLPALFNEIDLRKLHPIYQTPIFMMFGSQDLATPGAAAKSYFDTIQAPAKAFIVMPGAGHFVMMERPGQTLMTLVTQVRPWATAAGGGRDQAAAVIPGAPRQPAETARRQSKERER